jgi:hypothetical protein
MHILMDAVPLLEQTEMVFNVEEVSKRLRRRLVQQTVPTSRSGWVQTQTLMQCLQEVELSHNRNEYMEALGAGAGAPAGSGDPHHEKPFAALAEPVRLALARNLARALIMLPN